VVWLAWIVAILFLMGLAWMHFAANMRGSLAIVAMWAAASASVCFALAQSYDPSLGLFLAGFGGLMGVLFGWADGNIARRSKGAG
jgi:hypothetical protein